jgi:hypothetical protein
MNANVRNAATLRTAVAERAKFIKVLDIRHSLRVTTWLTADNVHIPLCRLTQNQAWTAVRFKGGADIVLFNRVRNSPRLTYSVQ